MSFFQLLSTSLIISDKHAAKWSKINGVESLSKWIPQPLETANMKELGGFLLGTSSFLEMTLKYRNSLQGLCQEPTVQLASMLLIIFFVWSGLIFSAIRMSYGCHTDVILTFSNWLMELIDAYGNAYGNNLR